MIPRTFGTTSRSRRPVTALGALALAATVALTTPMPATAAPALPATSAVQPQPAAAEIRYGQRSGAVRSFQNRLIAAGVLLAHHNSGYFGDQTRTAVRKVQRSAKLPVTGRVNAATRRAVERAVARASGPKTWYHRETIGTSTEGRPIVAYRAGEAGKPVVMVVATMHGEENFGQYVAQGLLEGRTITGVDLWVVPVLNPDGLAKDRRWVGNGVDLNRNFPHKFIRRANSGPRANSVKETGVVMRFLDRVKPRYLVSWHQPLIGVDTYAVKDRGLMRRLSSGLDIAPRYLDCHGSCHGTMTGWYNSRHRGAAITVEYGTTARSLSRMKGRDANAVLTAIGGSRG